MTRDELVSHLVDKYLYDPEVQKFIHNEAAKVVGVTLRSVAENTQQEQLYWATVTNASQQLLFEVGTKLYNLNV